MTPTKIRANVVSERAAWVREMIHSIQGLPLSSYDEFAGDRRNVASAESYLRRGIEALLDLGRHILAKGFAVVAAEYKEIGTELAKEGVLSEDQGMLLRQIAGYRNRMVHFYHEVTQAELYQLSTEELKDIESLLEALVRWLQAHPEKLDQGI
ncbi:MAG: DUF86 domain-containing protein [Deltaproteobacteria bacterium]|nr:DUF86 domain-containing protein [Deltaproteobacteria bacterium]